MVTSELIFSINNLLQASMIKNNTQSVSLEEAITIVYQHKTIDRVLDSIITEEFTLKQIVNDIRKRYDYPVLKQLLGVEQKDNKPRGKYTFYKFDPPSEERIRALFSIAPVQHKEEESAPSIETIIDYLSKGLDIVFVGTSVGEESAKRDGYYAHAKNRFWDLVNTSKLVTDWIGSENCRFVLEEHCGLTDLVKEKFSKSDATVRNNDFDVAGFLEKIKMYKPRVVAFNGREAFKEVFNCTTKDYGLTEKHIGDSKVFVLPSSNGTDTSLTFNEKLEWYKNLKSLI